MRDIPTSRFGLLRVKPDDFLYFPAGLLGLEDCRNWVLLGDEQNDAMAWLQSTERSKTALAVVSPRRFVPGYQIQLARMEIEPLELDNVRMAELLLVVGRSASGGITLNLKAPLVINIAQRLGRQVITNGDLPVRYELRTGLTVLKKTA